MKDEIKTMNKDKTITLKSGQTIPCDVLILGTGFCKNYDIFDTTIQKALDIQSDGLYLYRHMIAPEVSDLAFCGSEIATISNIATYAIQAEWIKKVLSDDVQLPSVDTMLKEVNEMKAWKRSWMPETAARASLVLLHQIHYHDSLLRDMKINHKRKKFILSEMFMPYMPTDYKHMNKQ